jgi:hypothetical protein
MVHTGNPGLKGLKAKPAYVSPFLRCVGHVGRPMDIPTRKAALETNQWLGNPSITLCPAELRAPVVRARFSHTQGTDHNPCRE